MTTDPTTHASARPPATTDLPPEWVQAAVEATIRQFGWNATPEEAAKATLQATSPLIAAAVRAEAEAAIERERRSTPDADEYSVGYETAIDNCLHAVRRGSTMRAVNPPQEEPDFGCFTTTNELDTTVSAAAARDPALAASIQDAEARQTLLDSLVRLRHTSGLSRREVARRVGCSPTTIARFESEDSDPPISLLQRYARAVGVPFQPAAS